MGISTKRDVKTVLITGATSGIGSAIAKSFAKEGCNLLCHYVSSDEKAAKLKEELVALGAKCEIIKADFLKLTEIKGLIGKAKSQSIDVLVNNAGTYISSKHFTELEAEDIINTFMVNTFASMLLSSALFPGMKEKKFGRIVNISSIAAKYGGSAYSMHYGCSKRALEGATKTLAKEGAQFNVLVNTVRPGVIDTEFHKKFPKDMAKRIEMIPMKKMGSPEAVADLVFFLGSGKNSYVTNQIINVSGGE